MSQDPNILIEKFKNVADGDAPISVLREEDFKQILSIIEHAEKQIEELRKLARPLPSTVIDETVLQEADHVVSHDRQAQYGHPRDDMQRTAAMWEPILGLPPGAIDPEKVAMCQIAVKLSRLCNAYKRDSIVDIAGYAKCIAMMRQAAPK